jgi:hypothetical protein
VRKRDGYLEETRRGCWAEEGCLEDPQNVGYVLERGRKRRRRSEKGRKRSRRKRRRGGRGKE